MNTVFTRNNVTAEFLASGDLAVLSADGMMINQLVGQPFDGSLVQLYLRIHGEAAIDSQPMIGSNADSQYFADEKGAYWQGEFQGVRYQVAFTLSDEGIWFWTVSLTGDGQKVDVIYGQDLGNATPSAVLTNEAYMSQYLDHKVSQTSNGYVITSRQNQLQAGKYPVVQQGSLTKTIGFSTDGYQFFGREYKKTESPVALQSAMLPNEVYQYEFAYTALQSPQELLTNEATQLVFYGGTKGNQTTPVVEPIYSAEAIQAAYGAVGFPDFSGETKGKSFGTVIAGTPLSEAKVEELFPQRKLTEKLDDQLLSFFTPDEEHVVLQEKEVLQERTTGHILLSGMDLTVERPPLATTVYTYGIFNSQIVLGNTSMNKLMSNSRNSLNLQKASGQRIYLKEAGKWRNLGLPSAFKMGLNTATWYYQLPDDLLVVTTYTVAAGHEIHTTFTSQKQRQYTLAVTNHLLMSGDDTSHALVKEIDGQLIITSDEDSAIRSEYPDLVYSMTLDQPYQLTDEGIFGVADERLTVMVMEACSDFELIIQGSLAGMLPAVKETTVENEAQQFAGFIEGLIQGFRLSAETVDVESMNTLIRWYTHNMLVHYLSPHGLEQYGGAAWGTRDVSQGPAEFFLAVDRPEVVKEIIGKVFANQFSDDGNWPQWFMFDNYEKQKADESHGDVIVWPMKVVADYLAKTKDFEILSLLIPYSDRQTFLKTTEKATLMDHIKKEVAYIESHFLAGTYLSGYGDGDWDDTLQPYDSDLKKHMASSWTVALTYQVLRDLAAVLMDHDAAYAKHLKELSESIRKDFEKYMLGTDVIPGFVYLEDPEAPELMIHPTDTKTGIHYRLLPMTRSMIAELLTPEAAAEHLDLIRDQLYFPDGVRLMNRPANYNGGVSVNFKRAEQAANFGREIGLQYVHAHIRFTEAMAKLGQAEETWKALQTINPIQIKERVANAALRQANVYFSSSDGAFNTRYEAQERFNELKTGAAAVKGGWRIYSSGPGIYINQLLGNVLGIRESVEGVVFDPILPQEFDGAVLERKLLGTDVTITYHVAGSVQKVEIDGEVLPHALVENPYRSGGMKVDAQKLRASLKPGSRIEIYR